MALARDIADHLEAVGEPHLGDLAQGRVRLLRRRRIDARAHAALLRARLQGGNLVASLDLHPRLADELIDRRHFPSSSLLRSAAHPSTPAPLQKLVTRRSRPLHELRKQRPLTNPCLQCRCRFEGPDELAATVGTSNRRHCFAPSRRRLKRKPKARHARTRAMTPWTTEDRDA